MNSQGSVVHFSIGHDEMLTNLTLLKADTANPDEFIRPKRSHIKIPKKILLSKFPNVGESTQISTVLYQIPTELFTGF